MSRSNAAQEPSMDEILASIRRIIESGDEGPQTGPASAARPERAPVIERPDAGEHASKVVARLSPEPVLEEAADRRRGGASALRGPASSGPAAEGDGEAPAASGSQAEAAAPVAGSASFGLEEEDDLAARLRDEFAVEDMIDWSALTAALTDDEPAQSEKVASAPDVALSSDQRPADPQGRGAAAITKNQKAEAADAARSSVRAEPSEEASVAKEVAQSPFLAANSDSRRMQDFRAAVLDDAVDKRQPDDAPLVSGRTGELVGASFDELAEAIREGQLRSMEEMAQDLLRPMLQDWLDDNLPKLVERLVREEIERVARGGRR